MIRPFLVGSSLLATVTDAETEKVTAVGPVVFTGAIEESFDVETVVTDSTADRCTVNGGVRVAVLPVVHDAADFCRKGPGTRFPIVGQETDEACIFQVSHEPAVTDISAKARLVLIGTAGRERSDVVLEVEGLVVVSAATTGQKCNIPVHLAAEAVVSEIHRVRVQVAAVDQEVVAEGEARVQAGDTVVRDFVSDHAIEPAIFVAEIDIVVLGERPGGECECHNGGGQSTNHGKISFAVAIETG